MIKTITEQQLHSFKTIHFVGVGGSGMFPLAQILIGEGYKITGSDNNPGDTIDAERKMGIDVTIGHFASNIGHADAVVYSAAIPKDNVELAEARKLGIPVIERSEMLGLVSRRYDNCIGISGTHGKTSTTSMTTQILMGAGLDPSAFIGGKLKAIGGSGRAGKSDILVCEACEFVDTFLHLDPDVAVILNIDEDHLDYFGSLDNIIKSFNRFARLATKAVIINGDDENSRRAVEGVEKNILTFGLSESNDYYPKNIVWENGAHCSFDLYFKGEKLTTLSLNVPGKHNVLNAVAACAAALAVGAQPQCLAKGLGEYTGVGRRFEILGKVDGITVADDYAHHPTEIKATLEAAMGLGYKQVWAVFQPFTFSRTALLLDDFAKTLPIADKVVMSAIMGGRENNTYGISTQQLADKIPDSVWFESFEEIADYVSANAKDGDLVITLGCGDVYKCAKLILNKLHKA